MAIRVILAIDRTLLRDVLQRVLTRVGLDVVPRPSDPMGLLSSIASLHPDAVVFWAADGADQPGICSHLLYEYPRLKIVLLSPAAELSAEGILAALGD